MNIPRFSQFGLIAVFLLVASSSALAADVGVSISIGQPGFYGRIDIGDYPYPPPAVVYREPIIVHRHHEVIYEPIYLRVPPGHYQQWSRYCSRYDACDRPVYFVRDRWYHDDFAPIYREHHGYPHEERHEWREHERHERSRGHDHGRH